MKQKVYITIVTLLLSAMPALADGGFSDDWSFKSIFIFGILICMPFFLPSALLLSIGVATARAIIRKKRQEALTRFGSTFLVSILACSVLYVLGMLGYILIGSLVG